LAADNDSVWNSGILTRTYAERGLGVQSNFCLFRPELAILGELWPELRGQRILDLGVGGGRTTPYLLVLSDRYVGLDYAAGMVAAAKASYPTADIRHGDARDLAAFPDASFKFVLFSFNGIDNAPYEDRSKVLHEVYRVVEPGGYFAFSTHNLNFLHGEFRGVYRRPRIHIFPNPIRKSTRAARWAVRAARGYVNHRRLRSAEKSGEGYAIRNDASENYAILTCYVDPRVQCHALERSGFVQPPRIFGLDGRSGSVDSTDWWLHFLVAKPAGTR
jgi:ubiquinone/menaquinone biosynthesis C-methylase UbiE